MADEVTETEVAPEAAPVEAPAVEVALVASEATLEVPATETAPEAPVEADEPAPSVADEHSALAKGVEDAYAEVERVEAEVVETFHAAAANARSLLHSDSTYTLIKGEGRAADRVEQTLPS